MVNNKNSRSSGEEERTSHPKATCGQRYLSPGWTYPSDKFATSRAAARKGNEVLQNTEGIWVSVHPLFKIHYSLGMVGSSGRDKGAEKTGYGLQVRLGPQLGCSELPGSYLGPRVG